MYIFVIAPHRNITPEYRERIRDHVEGLESRGFMVWWPSRDTYQEGRSIDICRENLDAMRAADKVHVIWDGRSVGCVFDLGMALALGKPVSRVWDMFPKRTGGKSIANVVHDWRI